MKVYEVTIGGLPISIEQSKARGKRFTVRYWKQVKVNLTYAEAAKEFGECVFHALACESKLDNEGA